MARIRTIKPAFFLNNELANLSCRTRLLFIGLWTISDRRGFVEDIPDKIRAQIFPYERINVSKLLDELAIGFIERISLGDIKYIRVINFCKHQIVNRKEVESTVPEQFWKLFGTVPARGELYNCKTDTVKQEEEGSAYPPPYSNYDSVTDNERVFSYTETVDEFLKLNDWHELLCAEFEMAPQDLIDDIKKFLSHINNQGHFPRKLADTKKYYFDATKKHLASKANKQDTKTANYEFGKKKH